jgi:hypothetical protein
VASFIFFQTASSIMWFIIMATHMAYNQRIFSSWLYLKIKRATPSHSRARVWSLHRRSQVVLHKPTSGKKEARCFPDSSPKNQLLKYIYLSILKTTSYFENFSHSNRGHCTPHTGPTCHIFGGVDRVEDPYNRNLESVCAKKMNYFSPRGFLPTTYSRATHPPRKKYYIRRITQSLTCDTDQDSNACTPQPQSRAGSPVVEPNRSRKQVD